MQITVSADGWLTAGDLRCRCALGPMGITNDKKEGDGATPAGTFPLRRVLYRGDRGAPPRTALPVQLIQQRDGWCDDPAHDDYNQQVVLPHAGSHEKLWRDDHLYDVIVVLGYNDAPAVPGKGSAIFLHVAKDDYAPTEGCVAIARDDMRTLLRQVQPGDDIRIG